MIQRPCIEPGCNQTGAGTRCPGHTKQRAALKNRARSKAAPYNGGARQLRGAVNKAGGAFCEGCQQWHPASAIQIDHTIPLSQGGTDHPTNCRPLCQPCHQAKTATEQPDRKPPLIW